MLMTLGPGELNKKALTSGSLFTLFRIFVYMAILKFECREINN